MSGRLARATGHLFTKAEQDLGALRPRVVLCCALQPCLHVTRQHHLEPKRFSLIRPPARGLDAARGRRGFPDAVAPDQDALLARPARRAAPRERHCARRARDLAAAVPGASRPQRRGSGSAGPVLPHQPGETRAGGNARGVALFVGPPGETRRPMDVGCVISRTCRHRAGAGGGAAVRASTHPRRHWRASP